MQCIYHYITITNICFWVPVSLKVILAFLKKLFKHILYTDWYRSIALLHYWYRRIVWKILISRSSRRQSVERSYRVNRSIKVELPYRVSHVILHRPHYDNSMPLDTELSVAGAVPTAPRALPLYNFL